MRIQQDHRTDFHARAGTTGASMSPTISAVPAIQPNTPRLGLSVGTNLATATPLFVMTTVSRRWRTCSITRRQCVLNSPADMVLIATSQGPWSHNTDHFLGIKNVGFGVPVGRSEEHTSELQSLRHLVCRI